LTEQSKNQESTAMLREILDNYTNEDMDDQWLDRAMAKVLKILGHN